MDKNKEKALKMLKKIEKCYDSLYFQSLTEGFFPLLHNKEMGIHSYYGSFTIKNEGKLYKFTLGEDRWDNYEETLYTVRRWIPIRFLTIEKDGKVIYDEFDWNPVRHLEEMFENGLVDESRVMNKISDLLEEWEILYSWHRQSA